MKYKTLLLILSLSWSIPNLNAKSLQQQAQTIQQAYQATETLVLEFTQETYVEVLEQKVHKQGQAQFKKPDQFAIVYQGQRGRHYISNGKKLWIYQSGDQQVQVHPINEETIPAEALSFLGGLGNLNRDFAVEDIPAKKWEALQAKRGQLNWLQLTPLQKRSQIEWLVMGFDPQSHLAKEVYLLTDSGNMSHYKISKILTNQDIPKENFVFKKKGVKAVKVNPK